MLERVETLGPLSLIVAITLGPREGSSSGLKDFVVPPEGAIVTVIVSSPGLVANGDIQLNIHVAPDADSEPYRFAFTAGPVGLHPVTVETYRGGNLGAVRLQVSVEQSAATVSERKVRIAELPNLFAGPGVVTLQVRRVQGGHYRFQLLGDPRARSDRKRIVLPDGDDDRILKATGRLLQRGVADLTILGDEAQIRLQPNSAWTFPPPRCSTRAPAS